jgi:proteasome beta subunit
MAVDIDKYVLKTGTLTVGIVCKDGIVLAADNRISYGNDSGVAYIAGTAKKVLEISDSCIVTMAGTASDAVKNIKMLRAELRLKELKTKKKSTVREIASLLSNFLFQKIREPSMIPSIAHYLIAGYDKKGFALYDATPDGNLTKVETYQATGAPFESLSMFDVDYRKDMTLKEGIEFAKKAFRATMGRQPGVGDGFDIYTIKENEIKQVEAKKIILEEKDKN